MRIVALITLCVLSGCGPTTYSEFCGESAKETCTTAFKCDRAAAEKSWRDLQGCIDDVANAGSCREAKTKTCYLAPDVTRRCLDDLKKRTCDAKSAVPDSCAAVVCADDKKIRCTSAESTFSSTGCARKRTQCSDGIEYRIECGDMKCTCFRGTDEGRDFDRSTFCVDGEAAQDAAFSSRCSYEL